MGANYGIIEGVVRDIQPKTTQNGKSFKEFTLAVPVRDWKTGNDVEHSYQAQVFGDKADAVSIGDTVAVFYRREPWESQYGTKWMDRVNGIAITQKAAQQYQQQPQAQNTAQYAPAPAPSAYRQQPLPGMPATPAQSGTFGQYPKFTPGQTVPQTPPAPATAPNAQEGDPNDVPF